MDQEWYWDAVSSRYKLQFLSSSLIVSHCLLYQKNNMESCPSEVEFICNNSNGPVVTWMITSVSGVLKTIVFHSFYDTQGIWRSAVIDYSVANAMLLYGNSSWYLTSLTISSTLSSDIACNSESLQHHSSNR